jgi:predicted nuclease of predicted toxin-antitoxin system
MAKFLANENVPDNAVEAARRAGVDITWVRDISPGISDEAVLTLSQAEGRILRTFDKDFGEMAFEQGKTATPGVILLRPRLRSPEYVAQFTVALLSQSIDWTGNFSVAQEGRLRVVPLPD